MSILPQSRANGVFLGHHKDSNMLSRVHWREDLYAIHSPFMMDSQAERIRRERDEKAIGELRETSAQRKRKRKASLKKSLSEAETKVITAIQKALPLLVESAREMKILEEVQCALRNTDNNRSARVAAELEGCGDMFRLLCYDMDVYCGSDCSIINLDAGHAAVFAPSDIIGVPVTNTQDRDILAEVGGHKFVIPTRSCFLTSSFLHFVSHGASRLSDTGYDLVVMDPPWINKSVKRKKSYNTLTLEELALIPMERLCRSGAVVCVWVTNNERQGEAVREKLFPAWGVTWLADWIWMKVTLSGEPVTDLTSPHKKPYEQIIIGHCSSRNQNLDTTQHTDPKNSISRQANVNSCSARSGSVSLPGGGDGSADVACAQHSNLRIEGKETHGGNVGVEFAPHSNPHIATEETHGGNVGVDKNTDKACPEKLNKDEKEYSTEASGVVSAETNPSLKDDPRCGHETKLLESSIIPSPDMPHHFVLASVPCALHSKKPSLGDVLQPYLPDKPQCLELFARNLTRGWTCWGDEPLRHQHTVFFENPTSL